MRKTTKGALAIGAGVALLLGGAGTLANWSDSKNLGANTTISSGTLTIASKTQGSWGWASGTGTFVPGTSKLVPGDSIKITDVFTVTALGDHLTATAAYVSPTLSGALAASLQISTALGSVTNKAGNGTVTPTGTTSVSVTSTDSAATTFDLPVTVTITLPSTVSNLTAQTVSAAIADGSVTLTQN
jgi:alternate signal-mediated exported protein